MRSLALRLTRRAATSARAPLAATVLATRRAAAAAAAAASRVACRVPLASSARSMSTASPAAGAGATAAAAKPKRDAKPAEPAPVVLPAPASVAAALAQSGAPLQHVTVGTHPASPYAVAVTLNRPALHNAFNEHVISELTRAFRAVHTAVESDKTSTSAPVRCVVLGAHGKSFSAGADLSWMKAMAGYSHDENKVDSHKLFDMFASIFDCPSL